jgi:hypothetical protein
MSYVSLSLKYEAYAEIKIPKEHSKQLESGEWPYYIRWGVIYYTDDKGEEHEIQASEPEVLCKFPLSEVFEYHDTEKETMELLMKNKKAAAEYIERAARAKIEAAAKLPTIDFSEKEEEQEED